MTLPTNPHQTYTSPKGFEFRLICLEKIPETAKWIDRVEKHRWRAVVKMLVSGELLVLESDYNDNIVKKYKFNYDN